MKKFNFTPLIVALLFLFVSQLQAAPKPVYSNIYIFGDSLSDTGNLASVREDFPLPYYMNRVSNGPVAVEILAERLGFTAQASFHLLGMNSGTNYAVAGANAYGDQAIDLAAQVIAFQVNHGFIAPSDALYVIFIGGNDIRSARGVIDESNAEIIIKAAANEVGLAIESLSQSGAQSFLLVNAPDIGLIPETKLIAEASADPELVMRANSLSESYRKSLRKLHSQYNGKNNIKVIEFDLFQYFNKLIHKAEKFGFTNSTDACFSSEAFVFNDDCINGDNFNEFIFFDEIHPTARVHSLVGNKMAEKVLKGYKKNKKCTRSGRSDR